jgi:hypothetical protein
MAMTMEVSKGDQTEDFSVEEKE